MAESKKNIVALIEWSHLIEDFLDNIGITFEDFSEKMTGGWLFGYIEALKLYDVETVLFCFSAKVKTTVRLTHKLTGTTICVLPAPRLYRYIRKRILNPYATTIEEAAGNVSGIKRYWFSFLLKISAYASTPFFKLYNEIKIQQGTVILCQDYEHARFDICVLLGKMLRLPVYASFQGGNWQLSSIEKYIRWYSLKWCAGLIVASEIETERLKNKYKLAPCKLKKIFNPIDLSMWTGPDRKDTRAELNISTNAMVVMWHGRVDYYRKGLDILLDAWEQITTEQPLHAYQLWLVGTGNNADLLKQRLGSNKLKGVQWIDRYINDRKLIYTYLKSANVYVFPSRNEGFPVAPLEAMACGLPLIATDAPGVPDILKNGEASGGILLPKDNSNLLAAAIKKLLTDTVFCDKLGKLAEQNVKETFSLNTVGHQLNQLLFKKITDGNI